MLKSKRVLLERGKRLNTPSKHSKDSPLIGRSSKNLESLPNNPDKNFSIKWSRISPPKQTPFDKRSPLRNNRDAKKSEQMERMQELQEYIRAWARPLPA
jgi:hypothetical protein